MGFCRRCGDIVVGQRCGKCGGASVAAAVKWNVGNDNDTPDRWSKTYVTKPESTRAVNDPPLQPSYTGQNASPTKRFPKPLDTANTTKLPLSSRVSAHIASATSARPASGLKSRASIDASTVTESHAEQGILPSPHGSELAKVYGSILQPKETLASFSCAICSTVFAPDATIYPDPSSINSAEADGMPGSSDTRFLCRPCFTVNGGSKGNCPACHRPVLILKSEGGFVETGGQVWHKKCFCCEGCDRNIGDQPMVDLLGRPCCSECFDTCLKRPAKSTDSPARLATPEKGKMGNLGGRRLDRGANREKEDSPALDELEARLGISKSKDNTLAMISVGRLNMAERGSPFATPSKEPSLRDSTTSAPSNDFTTRPDSELSEAAERPSSRRHSRTSLNDATPSPRTKARRSRSRTGDPSDLAGESAASNSNTPRKQPTEEAIEEMKRRFLSGNGSSGTPVKSSATSSSSTTPRRRSRSRPRASLGDAEKDSLVRGSPALRTSASTNSLRSALLSQRTGETELGFETDFGSEQDGFNIIPDRTGESTQPLRIRRNRTGNSDYTEIERDFTGATTTGFDSVADLSVVGAFSTDDELLDRYKTIRPVRTGDVALGYESCANMSDISEPVRSHRTGDYTAVPRQRTGDRPLRAQRTGDREVRRQTTGSRNAPEPEGIAKLSLSSSSSLGSITRQPIRDSESSYTSLNGGMRNLAMGSKTGSFSNSSVTSSGYDSSVSSAPDLASDYSDATSSRSSLPATPPPSSPPLLNHDKTSSSETRNRNITPTRSKRAQTFSHLLGLTVPEEIPPDTRCEKCRQPLFSSHFGGKFVTVPEEPSSTGALPKRYHTACFKCKVCGEAFEEKEGGHAVFVRVPEGACHVRCAPPEKITLRKTPAAGVFKPSKIPVATSSPDRSSSTNTDTHTAIYTSSSRYERPPPTAPATTTSFSIPQPRFGGSAACPGCQKAVSPMERGVVPGPQGSKWHGSCLICGGQEAKGKRKIEGKAGCGKKLDSAAKMDAEGGVWCRECLLLLPAVVRQATGVRSPVVPTNTGGGPFARVVPQTTGTTIARQFTGIGTNAPSAPSDAELLRQLTGGGSSPNRQLTSSPTKLYDGPRPGRMYPRPKSVTGTRSTSGEGRGMFLVRQLTGGNGSFSGNEYGL